MPEVRAESLSGREARAYAACHVAAPRDHNNKKRKRRKKTGNRKESLETPSRDGIRSTTLSPTPTVTSCLPSSSPYPQSEPVFARNHSPGLENTKRSHNAFDSHLFLPRQTRPHRAILGRCREHRVRVQACIILVHRRGNVGHLSLGNLPLWAMTDPGDFPPWRQHRHPRHPRPADYTPRYTTSHSRGDRQGFVSRGPTPLAYVWSVRELLVPQTGDSPHQRPPQQSQTSGPNTLHATRKSYLEPQT